MSQLFQQFHSLIFQEQVFIGSLIIFAWSQHCSAQNQEMMLYPRIVQHSHGRICQFWFCWVCKFCLYYNLNMQRKYSFNILPLTDLLFWVSQLIGEITTKSVMQSFNTQLFNTPQLILRVLVKMPIFSPIFHTSTLLPSSSLRLCLGV